ncbi:hypothetical protein ACFYOY_25085 [Streptomyces sp. NPDC007875]
MTDDGADRRCGPAAPEVGPTLEAAARPRSGTADGRTTVALSTRDRQA